MWKYSIYILYIIWYIHIYSIYIYFFFPRLVTDQTNSRFRSLLEDGAPKPFNADEDISFFFGAWKKLTGIFQRQRIYGGEGNMLRCLLLSRDLLKKKQGITGQHIPWTGSLVIHPLHKVIYLFHSIETWIEKWPDIFLKNTEINLILYIHVSWCRIKLTIKKKTMNWVEDAHSSVWFPPAIDHFTIWVCPPTCPGV